MKNALFDAWISFRPAGDAFEEYLLDETTCARPQDFLCRLALPVEPA